MSDNCRITLYSTLENLPGLLARSQCCLTLNKQHLIPFYFPFCHFAAGTRRGRGLGWVAREVVNGILQMLVKWQDYSWLISTCGGVILKGRKALCGGFSRLQGSPKEAAFACSERLHSTLFKLMRFPVLLSFC